MVVTIKVTTQSPDQEGCFRSQQRGHVDPLMEAILQMTRSSEICSGFSNIPDHAGAERGADGGPSVPGLVLVPLSSRNFSSIIKTLITVYHCFPHLYNRAVC